MQSFDRNEDISTDNDVDSDKIAIEINSQELKECQSNFRELKEKRTESSHNQSSMICYQDRKYSQPRPTPDSAEDDNEESSFTSSSSSTSDAEDEDEPLDALQDKGWMDEVPLPSSQLQHEMNGHVLPANNPSEFGDVCIKNSSNVHLGSRVFYKGPVTIKQFVYTNSAAITDNPESLQSDGEKLKSNTTNSDSKSFDNLSLSKRPSHIFNFLAHNKGWFRIKQWVFTICIMISMLVSLTILGIWLSSTTISTKRQYLPVSLNDSSISNDLTIPGVRIIPRIEWGAQPPSKTPTPLGVIPVTYVIISHTASIFCYTQAQCVLNVRVAQTFHIESKGWNDIAYNFLVGGDGLVYEGRGWNIEGAHTFNYNYQSIGISFIGTFNEVEPTKAQLYATEKLIELGIKENYISKDYKLLGHRQCIKTESPGETLYNIIKTWHHWSPTP